MSMMMLSLVAPLSATVGYAVAGWCRRTRWLAAAAASVPLVWSVVVLFGVDAGVERNEAAFIASIGAVALLAGVMLPGYLDHEVADRTVGPRSARWSAALTMAVLTAAMTAVLVGDLGLSWLILAATVVPVAALMTHRRSAPGAAAMRRLVKAAVAPFAVGVTGALAMWSTGPSGWSMVLLGLAVMAQVAVLPTGLARIGVMSHLPAPGAIVVFACVPAAAAAVVVRWSGQAAIVLGVPGVRSLLLVAGMPVLAAGIAAMLWSRDLRSLLGYTAMVGGGFVLLFAAAGPDAVVTVAVFTAAFGAAIASLIVATTDVLRVVGSSRMRLVAGWWERSRKHAIVMLVAAISVVGIPLTAAWFSQLDRWGMWPPAAVAVVAMGAAVAVAARRLAGPGPHPHLAVATPIRRPVGLPVMVSGVVGALAVTIVVMPWSG